MSSNTFYSQDIPNRVKGTILSADQVTLKPEIDEFIVADELESDNLWDGNEIYAVGHMINPSEEIRKKRREENG